MSAMQTALQMKKKLEKSAIKFYYGSEIEKKVADATSTKPWGASGTELQEIADATNDFANYGVIMRAVWGRLSDPTNTWRQIYKTLTLIDALIRQGSDRVVDDARHHIYEIRQLTDYRCIENGQDQGVNVREKARSVAELLNDEERIRDEREKARKTRGKFRNAVSSDGMAGGGGYGGYGGGYGGGSGGGGYGGSGGGGYGGSGGGGYGGYDDPPRFREDRDRNLERRRSRSRSPPRRRSRSPPRRRSPSPIRTSRSPPRDRAASSAGKIRINIASAPRDASPNRGPISVGAPAAQEQNLMGDLFGDTQPQSASSTADFFGGSVAQSGGDADFFNPRAAAAPSQAPQSNDFGADFGSFATGGNGFTQPAQSSGGFDAFGDFSNGSSAPQQSFPQSFAPQTAAPSSSDFGGFGGFETASPPMQAMQPLSTGPASKPATSTPAAAPQQQKAPKKPTMWDDTSSLVSLDTLSLGAKKPAPTRQAAATPEQHGPARKPTSPMSSSMGAAGPMGMGMGGVPMGRGMGMGMGMNQGGMG